MTFRKHLLASLIVGSLFAPSVMANAPASLADQPEQTPSSINMGADDTSDVIDTKLEEYISKKEEQVAQANKSHMIRFFSGSAEISVTRDNPDWAVYRSMALAEAMHRARDSYLKTLSRDFSEEQVREFFQNKGQPVPSAQDFKSQSRFEQLMGKAVALVDGYMTEQLEKMGISANEFTQAPPAKKQLLMRQYFENKTMSEAFGDLSGMFVIKTYEEYEQSGRGTIGVVMALSLEKRDKVVDLIESQGQVQPSPEKANTRYPSVKTYLKDQSAPYLNAGTQLMYDAKGYPMLIAYGQYGVVHTTDRDERSFEREAAYGFAEDSAWSALASAYNLNGEFARQAMQSKSQEKSRTTQLIGPNATRTAEGAIQKRVRKSVQESSKVSASLKDMTGVSVEHKWRMKHPATGHEIVGVALVWHPVKVRDSIEIQSGKRASELQPQQPKSTAAPSTTGKKVGYESEDRFDLSDF